MFCHDGNNWRLCQVIGCFIDAGLQDICNYKSKKSMQYPFLITPPLILTICLHIFFHTLVSKYPFKVAIINIKAGFCH